LITHWYLRQKIVNYRKKPLVVSKKTEAEESAEPATPIRDGESDEELTDIVIGEAVYYLSGETAFPEEILLQVLTKRPFVSKSLVSLTIRLSSH